MDITKRIIRGAQDATAVVVGKGLARSVPQALGLQTSGNVGLATQLAAAVVIGMGADAVVGRNLGRMVLAGALAAPIEGFVAQAGIPFISDTLGRYPGIGRYPVPQLGRYPNGPRLAAARGLGRYPHGGAHAAHYAN